jgi:hypothetical protein
MTIWQAYRNLFRVPKVPTVPTNLNLDLVFAVADTEPWWLAVHQVLEEAERETTNAARNLIVDTNRCIAAVGAGEGIDLIRQKLIDKRNLALRTQGGSNAIHQNRAESI